MLIVRQDELEKIKKGEKTQIRRKRAKARMKQDSIHQIKTNGLFGRPECLIKVTAVRDEEEVIGDISEEDAIAEGGFTPEEYLEYMIGLYGKDGLTRESKVWVIEFELHDHKRLLGEMRAEWKESQEARAAKNL
jgi:hypothetical protein